MRNWKGGGELCVSTLDQGRCVCVQLRARLLFCLIQGGGGCVVVVVAPFFVI
jgi:hypothetical protein